MRNAWILSIWNEIRKEFNSMTRKSYKFVCIESIERMERTEKKSLETISTVSFGLIGKMISDRIIGKNFGKKKME